MRKGVYIVSPSYVNYDLESLTGIETKIDSRWILREFQMLWIGKKIEAWKIKFFFDVEVEIMSSNLS